MIEPRFIGFGRIVRKLYEPGFMEFWDCWEKNGSTIY